MTYAITICFDDASASALVTARQSMIRDLHLAAKPSDNYAPHVTLAIFEDMKAEQPLQAMAAAWSAYNVHEIRFCGIGLLPSEDRWLPYIGVVPTSQLIDLHCALHEQFSEEKRRDRYYDKGLWLPHVTLAPAVCSDERIEGVVARVPPALRFHSAALDRLEIVFTADINKDPIDIIASMGLA
jgi:2'-5' RNA ligase